MQLWADHHLAVGRCGVEAVIVLMIVFGGVVGAGGGDFGHNRGGEVCLCGGFGRFGGCVLSLVVVENRGAVLGAAVAALAVERRGIVPAPEPVEQCFKADDCGIVVNLRDFGMAAGARADLAVSRIFYLPAHVAGFDCVDAVQLFKDGLDAPETASTEGGDRERFVCLIGHNEKEAGIEDLSKRSLIRFFLAEVASKIFCRYRLLGILFAREGSMNIVTIKECEDYLAEDLAVAKEFMGASNTCLKNLSIAEIRIPPGVTVKKHYHLASEETYHIVEGSGVMHLDGEDTRMVAGQAVAILPGQWHSIHNPNETALKMIVTCAPAWAFEDQVFE